MWLRVGRERKGRKGWKGKDSGLFFSKIAKFCCEAGWLGGSCSLRKSATQFSALGQLRTLVEHGLNSFG
jgi:hypothetical protein